MSWEGTIFLCAVAQAAFAALDRFLYASERSRIELILTSLWVWLEDRPVPRIPRQLAAAFIRRVEPLDPRRAGLWLTAAAMSVLLTFVCLYAFVFLFLGADALALLNAQQALDTSQYGAHRLRLILVNIPFDVLTLAATAVAVREVAKGGVARTLVAVVVDLALALGLALAAYWAFELSMGNPSPDSFERLVAPAVAAHHFLRVLIPGLAGADSPHFGTLTLMASTTLIPTLFVHLAVALATVCKLVVAVFRMILIRGLHASIGTPGEAAPFSILAAVLNVLIVTRKGLVELASGGAGG